MKQATLLREWLGQRSNSERETLARLWRLEPPAEGGWGAQALADAMLQPAVVAGVLSRLDERSRHALDRVLAEEGGQIAAAPLEREFGMVRSHDRYPNPRAYLLALEQPPSATEGLFTLGLILPVVRGGGHFYFVPEDLLPLLPEVPRRDRSITLHPAADPPEVVEAHLFELERNVVVVLALAQRGELQVIPTGGLNKASLLRLAKRWGQSREDLQGLTHEKHWRYVHFLRSILQGARLVRANSEGELRITSEGLKWLRLPRHERLRRLLDGWLATEWDELEQFLGMALKGYAVGRDLAATRQDILDVVRQAPVGAWVAWEELLNEVQRAEPDFLRRDGRYDTWRIVNYRRESLDGYEHWRDVEGELLQATIGGTLRWLGLIDYGGVTEGEGEDEHIAPTCFRLSPLGAAVLGVGPAPQGPADEPLVVQGTFELLVPPRAAPLGRFWAMCCAQEKKSSDAVEHYLLTKSSVQAALAADLAVETLIEALEAASSGPLPQNVAYSLREWGGQLGQLTLTQGVLLRAEDPLLLEQVRRDKRAQMPPHETLNPTTLLLTEGDGAAMAERLRKAGYGLLGDIEAGGGSGLSERDLTVLFGALEFYARACAELGIEGDASDTMRRRIWRMLNDRQRQKAATISAEALRALRGS